MRRRMWGTMIPLSFTALSAAYTSWFICTSCGFVETWVEQKKDLDAIREKLVKDGR